MGDAPKAYQERIRREQTHVWSLCTGGWERQIQAVGGVFTGLSVKSNGGGVLLVVKANFEGRNMVCFTSALAITSAMIMADTAILGNTARWRPDSYAGGKVDE